MMVSIWTWTHWPVLPRWKLWAAVWVARLAERVLLLAAAASLEIKAEAAAAAGAHSSLRAPRPDQFLLISSPREQKVVFSRITPGQSAGSMNSTTLASASRM